MTDDTLATYRVMELGAAVEAGMDTIYADLSPINKLATLEDASWWVPADDRPVTDDNRDSIVIARPPRPRTVTVELPADMRDRWAVGLDIPLGSDLLDITAACRASRDAEQ